MDSTSLFNRTYKDLTERRERILSGKVNCIPWGFPRFEKFLPGIEQGKYHLVTANSKVGKTQIADSIYVFNPIKQIVDNGLDIRLKIFYFSLEMTREEKMRSIFSNILYEKEGIRVSPSDLRSTKADKPISEEVLKIILKYQKYFEKMNEVITFIDDIRNPYGIYKIMRTYAEDNGKVFNKKVNIEGKDVDIFDYYEANDPDEYVMCIIDHISLIKNEKEEGRVLSLRESIGKLSSNYLVKLRNMYNYIPVVIQQQSASQEGLDNARAGKLKPTLDGLGENKTTQRDANVILGLFSPFRHDIPTYYQYDIKLFRDNIRFLEIIGGREGGAGSTTALYFDGAVNHFSELPMPSDFINLQRYHTKINKIRGQISK